MASLHAALQYVSTDFCFSNQQKCSDDSCCKQILQVLPTSYYVIESQAAPFAGRSRAQLAQVRRQLLSDSMIRVVTALLAFTVTVHLVGVSARAFGDLRAPLIISGFPNIVTCRPWMLYLQV